VYYTKHNPQYRQYYIFHKKIIPATGVISTATAALFSGRGITGFNAAATCP
jgi:hypothetical protein